MSYINTGIGRYLVRILGLTLILLEPLLGNSQELTLSGYLRPVIVTSGYEGPALIGFSLRDGYNIISDYETGYLLQDIAIEARNNTIRGQAKVIAGYQKQVDNLRLQLQSCLRINTLDEDINKTRVHDVEAWKAYAKKKGKKVLIYKALFVVGVAATAYATSPPRNDRRNTVIAGIAAGLITIVL